MLPSDSTLSSLGYHAVLHVDGRITDPGHGSFLQLVVYGGQTLRVRASPEVLRLGPFLQGRFRARLQLRTTLTGQLKPDLRLIDLTREGPPLSHPSRTCWTATGRVTARDQALLVVLPGVASPVRLAFQPDRGVAWTFGVGDSVHAVGVLRGDRVIVRSLQPAAALEPPRTWRRIPDPS